LQLSAEFKAPNVVLIVADDMQACFGGFKLDKTVTPNLNRLASEGVSFKKAYCQFPVCGPSRASFLSGLYPQTTRILSNNDKTYKATNSNLAQHPSLGEFMMQCGYYSARLSKMFHLGVPGEVEQGGAGADMTEAWDYTYDVMGPELYSFGVAENLTPSHHHHGSSFYKIEVPNHLETSQADALSTNQAIAFLENRSRTPIPNASNLTKLKPDAPFFLALGLLRPHVPLVAPKRFYELYPLDRIQLPDTPEGDLNDVPKSVLKKIKHDTMSELERKKTIQAYYACVSYLDEHVGRILDALDRLAIRDHTIVVFISDHGYNLGEHTTWQKMNFWEDTTRIPLIISSPSHKANHGKVCESIVEAIDLYPTLGDLVGRKAQLPKLLQGESLRPLLENTDLVLPEQSALTVMAAKDMSTLHYQNWRYSKWPDGEELYNHIKDPHEFNNLASHPEFQMQLEKLRHLSAQKQPE